MDSIRDLYDELGADYESVISIYASERLLEKNLHKFHVADHMATFDKAMESRNYKDAYYAAGNIFDSAMRMGFTELAAYAKQTTWQLRRFELTGLAEEAIKDMKKEYAKTIAKLEELFEDIAECESD